MRRDADEVAAVVPACCRRALWREPQVHLVHERGRLQRVPAALLAQIVVRQASQLGIDQRHERICVSGVRGQKLGSGGASVGIAGGHGTVC